jgi:hypothetical protein
MILHLVLRHLCAFVVGAIGTVIYLYLYRRFIEK